jgi:hypothetical protein
MLSHADTESNTTRLVFGQVADSFGFPHESFEIDFRIPDVSLEPQFPLFSGPRDPFTGRPIAKTLYGRRDEDVMADFGSCVAFPLMSSPVLGRRQFVALINGQHYNIHLIRDRHYLYQMVPGEKRCVAVELHDGDYYDGHRVQFQCLT